MSELDQPFIWLHLTFSGGLRPARAGLPVAVLALRGDDGIFRLTDGLTGSFERGFAGDFRSTAGKSMPNTSASFDESRIRA
ncbi:MAG: hypothetical protein WB440_13855, partial [Steroidobacteraceae bacterium]